jgi:hypothetical protein
MQHPLVLTVLRDSGSGAKEDELGACLSDMASPEDREQVHEAVREALIELQKIRLVERLEGD